LLALDRPIEKGAVTAVLAGDLIASGGGEGGRPRIDSERWLVFTPDDPDRPSLVVRVVSVEIGTDTTTIFWDPRRPAQVRYAPGSTRIHANVIPAHHGVLLTPLSDTADTGSPGFGAMSASQELLRPWREKMTIEVENEGESGVREVDLPFSPVSVWAPGRPLPDDAGRKGTPRIEVWVNGESWKRKDHLFMAKAGEDCFALRPGKGGGSALRFGDGVNGSSLPRCQVIIDIRMRVGLGEAGNVGTDALTKVLVFGDGGDIDEILPADADREEKISMHLKTTNVVAAVGGRDPESLEQIRYNAPRGVRDVLSAVSRADYERLLESLPETASARAVFVDAGLRGTVRITLLLRDEDTLVREELGEHSEAERLRRWAVVRHHLETIRLLGFDVELVPPRFVPLDLDLVVDAHEWAIASRLERQVVSALRDDGGLFDPDVSGLGGDVFVDRIHQAVLAVVGVAAVRVKRLRRLTPNAPDFAGESHMPIGPDEVAVLRNPHGDGEDGLVTVTVCGGMS
jgi:predicted phage baseplate assembly protein